NWQCSSRDNVGKSAAPVQERNRMNPKKVPAWLAGLLVGGTFVTLLWLERRRPLRRSVEPKARRNARNLAVAVLSAAAIQVAEKPLVGPLSAWVERGRWGLLPRWSLPA